MRFGFADVGRHAYSFIHPSPGRPLSPDSPRIPQTRLALAYQRPSRGMGFPEVRASSRAISQINVGRFVVYIWSWKEDHIEFSLQNPGPKFVCLWLSKIFNLPLDIMNSPGNRISSDVQGKVLEMEHIERKGPPQPVQDEEWLVAEKSLTRKLDLTLVPMVWLLYMFNYLDRNNIAWVLLIHSCFSILY